MSLTSGLFKRAFESIAVSYRNAVAKRIRAYGLKYDDLLVDTNEVNKAYLRLDPVAKLESERRIKRAYDLSAKKKTLPMEEQLSYDPFDFYLSGQVKRSTAELEERKILSF